MSTFEDLAQRYIDTWNETDPTARRAAVDALYSEDARYVDPLAVAEGREAIAATIGAVQGQFPGFVFRLARPVDAHHDQARFGWELGPAGQRPRSSGSTSPSPIPPAESRRCSGSSTRFPPPPDLSARLPGAGPGRLPACPAPPSHRLIPPRSDT